MMIGRDADATRGASREPMSQSGVASRRALVRCTTCGAAGPPCRAALPPVRPRGAALSALGLAAPPLAARSSSPVARQHARLSSDSRHPIKV